MNLTKGKITKLLNKKDQTRKKRRRKSRKSRKKGSLKKKRSMNLANKTLRNLVGGQDENPVANPVQTTPISSGDDELKQVAEIVSDITNVGTNTAIQEAPAMEEQIREAPAMEEQIQEAPAMEEQVKEEPIREAIEKPIQETPAMEESSSDDETPKKPKPASKLSDYGL